MSRRPRRRSSWLCESVSPHSSHWLPSHRLLFSGSRDRSSPITHVIGRLFPVPPLARGAFFVSSSSRCDLFFLFRCRSFLCPPSLRFLSLVSVSHTCGEPRFMRTASWDVCAKRLNVILSRVTVPACAERGLLQQITLNYLSRSLSELYRHPCP